MCITRKYAKIDRGERRGVALVSACLLLLDTGVDVKTYLSYMNILSFSMMLQSFESTELTSYNQTNRKPGINQFESSCHWTR